MVAIPGMLQGISDNGFYLCGKCGIQIGLNNYLIFQLTASFPPPSQQWRPNPAENI